jgi:uracil-DNA glycosylase family 4
MYHKNFIENENAVFYPVSFYRFLTEKRRSCCINYSESFYLPVFWLAVQGFFALHHHFPYFSPSFSLWRNFSMSSARSSVTASLASDPHFEPPPADCPLCPRLAEFRRENRRKLPGRYNGAVPSFGALDSELLIVGLAPGLQGANSTGRPFTGDYAGIILYHALLKLGMARGDYQESPDDSLELMNCRITNAVRCVPPANKPEPTEIKQCNAFLKQEIAAMPRLRAILSLGSISHKAVLSAFGLKASHANFVHGASHSLPPNQPGNKEITLFNTYHTSRYNINTGRLTAEMFEDVLRSVKHALASPQ